MESPSPRWYNMKRIENTSDGLIVSKEEKETEKSQRKRENSLGSVLGSVERIKEEELIVIRWTLLIGNSWMRLVGRGG